MGASTIDLSAIALCAFDLDGTLYKYTPAYIEALNKVQGKIVSALSKGALSEAEAEALCVRSYREHATPWHLPEEVLKRAGIEGVDKHVLHAAYHAGIVIDHIEPLPDLRAAFGRAAAAGVQSAVATHSHIVFAERMLDRLNIRDAFDAGHIVTLEQVGHRMKHEDEAMFLETMRRTGVAAPGILFIEDTLPNLEKAKQTGLKTAYIHWGEPLKALPVYVDIQAETPALLLDLVTAAKTAPGGRGFLP